MPRTCALILPFQPTLHRVSSIKERIQNAPKHYKTHQNMSLRSNGWIGFVRCQKLRCDFVARTFALIAPVQPVLHRVSCSNETIQNAPNHYEMHQSLSLGSNGESGAFVAKNFRCDFIAQNCPLIAPIQPISHWVSCSNETFPNAPKTKKCSKTWV